MKRGIDLRERIFGLLSVARTESEVCAEPVLWWCFCECQNTCVVEEKDLISGTVTSCGCQQGKDEK
jgi:hypothetical protein